MSAFTDMMVDVETTGNDDPSVFGCFHVAAIKFNAKTGEIGPMFDRVPELLPRRHWTGDTREFWLGRNREVYNRIIARSEPAVPVWQAFHAFCLDAAPDGGFRFWGKPITFDWTVIASHFLQLGMAMPFHYRLARDLNTYIAALRDDPAHPDMEKQVPFNGDKHNGLHDAAFQIDMLMEAQRRHIHASISG